MTTYNVILTYHDGSTSLHTFSSRYLADMFLAYIPEMQRAGELLDVARAIIERGVTYAN